MICVMADPVRLGIPLHTLRQFPWLRWALADQFAIQALENPGMLDAAAGWGMRTAGAYARRFASLRGLPCWTLEDGFYRSVGLGKDGSPSFSLVLDRTGIYFDARKPSDLENMLLAASGDSSAEALGARLRDLIVGHALTKYNTVPRTPFALAAPPGKQRILLIDQVAGDQSLPGAGANAATFGAMVRDALALSKEGRAHIFAKAHPDVLAGHAQGMIPRDEMLLDWVDSSAHIDAVLSEIDSVWTVSSQFGFEALMRGRPVVCYGAAFYAGWGLTEDRLQAASVQARAGIARRSANRLSLDSLVGIAAGRYPIYLDPVRQQRSTAVETLQRMADWRDRWFERRGRVLGIGIARHKRKLLRAYLGASGAGATFVASAPDKIEHDRYDEILVWSDRLVPEKVDAAQAAGLAVTSVEDGFIRSQGLSSRSNLAASLVFDRQGLHFDGSRPSDLETILASHPFPHELMIRAEAIIDRIVAGGVSKYNLRAEGGADIRALAGDRPVALVVAQVPGDASLRRGMTAHVSNADFLAAVMAEKPGWFVVYKEHPDVASGLRPGKIDAKILTRLCNLVVENGDIVPLLGAADEVHVRTSLAGFEALLRRKKVVCHGLPFYAGWGLTEDRVSCSRRSRKLNLAQLVAGALILYPKYLHPTHLVYCNIEEVIDHVR